jgi:hypothetical protein
MHLKPTWRAAGRGALVRTPLKTLRGNLVEAPVHRVTVDEVLMSYVFRLPNIFRIVLARARAMKLNDITAFFVVESCT